MIFKYLCINTLLFYITNISTDLLICFIQKECNVISVLIPPSICLLVSGIFILQIKYDLFYSKIRITSVNDKHTQTCIYTHPSLSHIEVLPIN